MQVIATDIFMSTLYSTMTSALANRRMGRIENAGCPSQVVSAAASVSCQPLRPYDITTSY